MNPITVLTGGCVSLWVAAIAFFVYAKFGSFHPHGYDAVMWILASIAAAFIGTFVGVMALLFKSIKKEN